MATQTEYITKPGDRWDLIAYKAYGTVDTITLLDGTTENAISALVRSNPDIPATAILEPGLLLQVPIIPDANVKTELASLPPWKR